MNHPNEMRIPMLDAQAIFEHLLALVGRQIEFGSHMFPKPIKGIIRNVMFDSFIVESGGENKIVRFEDLVFLNPV